MIYNIGTDLVYINRVSYLLEKYNNSFIERILSDKEIEILESKPDKAKYLAKRFAAKEALAKAFGTGIGKISFKDISILNYTNGMPFFEVSSKLKHLAIDVFGTDRFKLHVSISDDKDLALAFVTIEIINDK